MYLEGVVLVRFVRSAVGGDHDGGPDIHPFYPVTRGRRCSIVYYLVHHAGDLASVVDGNASHVDVRCPVLFSKFPVYPVPVRVPVPSQACIIIVGNVGVIEIPGVRTGPQISCGYQIVVAHQECVFEGGTGGIQVVQEIMYPLLQIVPREPLDGGHGIDLGADAKARVPVSKFT